MELLISIVILSLMYCLVLYWQVKARKEKEQLSKRPSAYRSRVNLLLILLVVSGACTTTRFLPTGQHQARLIDVARLPHSVASLKLLKPSGDTIYMLDRNAYMAPKRYYLGDWYSIRYDSTRKSVINGQCYFMAVLKHNQ